MKKVSVIVMSLVLAGAMAVPAFAGPGRGMGWGPGPYAGPQLTQEQITQLQKARSEFLKSTAELRKQLAVTQIDLRTELAQPTPDQAKVKSLSDQAVDLRAQLEKAHNAFLAANPNAGGPGRGFGPGRGPGACGGPGSGMGFGGGPRGGGYGPGLCWR